MLIIQFDTFGSLSITVLKLKKKLIMSNKVLDMF